MFNLFKKTQEAIAKTRDSWFGKVARLLDRPSVTEETWQELEELLIAADVGMSTTTRLLDRIRDRAKKEKATDGSQVRAILMDEMVRILEASPPPAAVADSRPQVVLIVGVNGSGKTTSIAKLANWYRGQQKQVLLAAADTFRAAAIDQLRIWGERVGAPVIAHQPGADPGAVVFDALQASKSRQSDVVIIDTAGRLHTKSNLMEELKKVRRVATRLEPTAPHQVILVMDATTGQNGLAQAKYFTEAVGVSGIFLAKLDGTAKGGIVLSIVDELKLPILYIGTGEKPDDMLPFDARAFVEALCSP
ncbi:MAG: signal recognition particle-docking protein FtsY [Chloroflexi bacterium]|nr:signal recognition particle-docking protein FtsY [Chloroflexota bacterium]